MRARRVRVAVTGRTEEQVRAVAEEIGGLALVGDVSQREDVERWASDVEAQLGPIDLLVNNAGVAGESTRTRNSGKQTASGPKKRSIIFCSAMRPTNAETGRRRLTISSAHCIWSRNTSGRAS